MTALVAVKLRLHRFEARVPDCLAVFDIEVASVRVERNVVVAVAGNAAEAGIGIECVSACSVGNEGEELLIAKIVDPGIRGERVGNYILPVLVVEIAELHVDLQKFLRNVGTAYYTMKL